MLQDKIWINEIWMKEIFLNLELFKNIELLKCVWKYYLMQEEGWRPFQDWMTDKIHPLHQVVCHSPSLNTSEQLDSGESGSLKGKEVSLIVFSESLGLYSSHIIIDCRRNCNFLPWLIFLCQTVLLTVWKRSGLKCRRRKGWMVM